jgi:Zn-dependent protease with chaperone function
MSLTDLASVALLLVPLVLALGFRYSAIHSNETGRAARWIRYCRWSRVLRFAVVAAWWALWEIERQSSTVLQLEYRYLDSLGSELADALLFLAPPTAIVAMVHMIRYSTDRGILGQRWTLGDILKLTTWGTVSPTLALLLIAIGFTGIYDSRWISVLWLIAGGVSAVAGALGLRSAEGLKFRRVKSGELYKRAFFIAKEMNIPLKRVYVVPAGRGQLTNAYGLSNSIALTDNYGKFLAGAELDFVIGHELAHVKARNARGNMLMMFGLFAGLLLAVLLYSPIPSKLRPWIDFIVIFVPALTFYFRSRRSEYAADRFAVELTHDPEAGVEALCNLYRITLAPAAVDWFTGLFMTHPTLADRAVAIGQAGNISMERVSEVIRENLQEEGSA